MQRLLSRRQEQRRRRKNEAVVGNQVEEGMSAEVDRMNGEIKK